MQTTYNTTLLIAAGLSVIAALLHIGCIVGGPAWYRFFGAGERIARQAEEGSWQPALITSGITMVLLIWAGYALSAAGALPPFPLLKIGIVVITAIYLLRGLALFPVLLSSPQKATPFVVWSSLVCIGFGAVHMLGVVQVWERL